MGSSVSIVSEEAVIIWDAAEGIQHFIRRADFQTDAPSFGFIVPTPTVPELAEANLDLFTALAAVVRPRVESRRVISGVTPTCVATSLILGGHSDATPPPPVTVLRRQTVAGYDAVVLEAADSEALSEWLEANGYAASDALSSWAEPYVARRWKFTAFKVTSDSGEGHAGTSPVHMTFATETPFYPYREPASTEPGSEPRALRVFFIAEARYGAALADGTPWPGKPSYARALKPGALERFIDPGLLTSASYLTAFVDESSPRPGHADLLFTPDPGGDVVPEATVRIREVPLPIPLELVILAAGVGGLLYRRRRRSRA